jgi:hypothetical protein
MVGEAHAQDGADDGAAAGAQGRQRRRVAQQQLGDLDANIGLARPCSTTAGTERSLMHLPGPLP